ncbi:MAG: hypothetical protein J0M08_06090 [Bacteroidetes bacterium]|nr:hypothetical protein [Bacteroidota bacterium]
MNKKKAIDFGKYFFIFYILFFLLSYYFYSDWIYAFPRNTHAWTQSDRYALAMHYYEYGNNLFHPALYNLRTIEGITASDFTIHEYLVSKLMSLFGNSNPIVFRLYTLLYCSLGLFLFFRLIQQLTNSVLWGIIATYFVYLIPVYAYNQDGFIPSATSFSSFLIGLYFLHQSNHSKKPLLTIMSVCFFVLAALCRLPFAIFLIALLLKYCLESIKQKQLTSELKIIGVGIFLFISHTIYSFYLGNKYGYSFLFKPLTIKSINDFKIVFQNTTERWIFIYFTKFHYSIILLLISIFLFLRKKTTPVFSLVFIGLSGIGTLCYLILHGMQLIDHDYYFIDTLLPVTVLLLSFMLSRIDIKSKVLNKAVTFISIILLIGASRDCKAVLNERFILHTGNRVDQTTEAFKNSNFFLDTIGVPKDAKILVVQAYTTNIPFMLMKRKGYAIVLAEMDYNRENYFEKNFSYVVMPTQYMLQEVIGFYPKLLNHLQFVACNGKISVYKYNNIASSQSIESFVGISNASCIHYFPKTNLSSWTKEEVVIANQDSVYTIKNGDEYPMIWNYKLEKKDLQKTAFLFKGKIQLENNSKLHFVQTSKNKEKEYWFMSYSANEYSYLRESNYSWTDFYFMFPTPSNCSEGDEMKLYLYNESKKEFHLKNVQITTIRY